MNADEYNTEMEKADYVISRSGYSTVMDILTLGKKSILIPTPGQTEQEYLATYLAEKKIAFCNSQKDFSLEDVLQKASSFDFAKAPDNNQEKLSTFINCFLKAGSNDSNNRHIDF